MSVSVDQKESIGERIKKSRKSQKISQVALAKAIGIKQPSLSEIENGQTEPREATLIALGRELKDDFGLHWLKERLNNLDSSLQLDEKNRNFVRITDLPNDPTPSREEIIEQTSVEEIFSIKFGGGVGTRTKEEIQKLRQLAEQKLKEIKALNDE